MTEAKYTAASTGPKIDHFLKQLLSDAGLELSFFIEAGHSPNPEIENPEIMVKFAGRDLDLLLANRAELLLALEQVTMEVLRMPNEDHSRISFDANDYRLLRIEELRISAGAAAEKVKHSGVPFRFNPMNSRERRVVHLALRSETTLRSESSGVGGYRHVVIYPEGMASLPDPPPPPMMRRAPSGPPRDSRDARGGRDKRGGRGDRRPSLDRNR